MLGIDLLDAAVDAEILYAMVRHTKPRRLYEFGSGASSHVIAAAGEVQRGRGASARTRDLRSVSVHGQCPVRRVRAAVRATRAQDIETSVVQRLRGRDLWWRCHAHLLDLIPCLARGTYPHPRHLPAVRISSPLGGRKTDMPGLSSTSCSFPRVQRRVRGRVPGARGRPRRAGRSVRRSRPSGRASSPARWMRRLQRGLRLPLSRSAAGCRRAPPMRIVKPGRVRPEERAAGSCRAGVPTRWRR